MHIEAQETRVSIARHRSAKRRLIALALVLSHPVNQKTNLGDLGREKDRQNSGYLAITWQLSGPSRLNNGLTVRRLP
jgi:hypothetical protein